LKQRDEELTAREAGLNKAEQAILASRSRYEGKEKGLDEREKVLAAPRRSWRSAIAALNLREAQLEGAEFEVTRAAAGAAREGRRRVEATLSTRESDLSMYVATAPGELRPAANPSGGPKQLGNQCRQSPAA